MGRQRRTGKTKTNKGTKIDSNRRSTGYKAQSAKKVIKLSQPQAPHNLTSKEHMQQYYGDLARYYANMARTFEK